MTEEREPDRIVLLPEGGWMNRTLMERMAVECGPGFPDDPGVCYDPDTEEGQAALREYQARRQALYARLDAKWEANYPGVSLNRLVGHRAREAVRRKQDSGVSLKLADVSSPHDPADHPE